MVRMEIALRCVHACVFSTNYSHTSRRHPASSIPAHTIISHQLRTPTTATDGSTSHLQRPNGLWCTRHRFWYVQYDILGGLSQLNLEFRGFVERVYGGVLSIHIAALVLTVLIMAGFLALILRPFLAKTTNETRRIAELLSQLPPDIDVEGLVARAVIRPGASVAPAPTGHVSSGKGMISAGAALQEAP